MNAPWLLFPVAAAATAAATAGWDAIVITHSAFKFIPVPAAFERGLVADQLRDLEELLGARFHERRLELVVDRSLPRVGVGVVSAP